MIYGEPGQKSKDKESNSHLKAKIRVAKLVDDYLSSRVDQYIVEYEHKFPEIITALGPREYIADIFVQTISNNKSRFLDIELDGKLGHWTKINRLKDNVRDFSLDTILSCPVARLNTYWVSGYFPKMKSKYPRKKIAALSDEEIYGELKLEKLLLEST